MVEPSRITNRNRSHRSRGRAYRPPLIQAEARLCPNCEKPTSLGSFRCSQCRKPLNPFKAHPQSTQESALFLDPAGNARVILAYCVDGFISVFAIMVLSLTFSVNLDTNIIVSTIFKGHFRQGKFCTIIYLTKMLCNRPRFAATFRRPQLSLFKLFAP